MATKKSIPASDKKLFGIRMPDMSTLNFIGGSKAKKAKAPVVADTVKTAPSAYKSPTKKVKVTKKLTKRDIARNKKIAKGNKTHGHGRK